MSLDWVTFPEVKKVLATTATTIAETVTTFLTDLCDLLTTSDNIAALGHDPVRDLLAVANGDHFDVVNPRSDKRLATIAVGETVTAISMYDGAVWVATATKGIYYADYLVDIPQNAGGAGLVDGLLWSTTQDSNPDWNGPVYTPPVLFLVEADAAGWEVWDVSSGTPVSDLTQAKLNLTSINYREGLLLEGRTDGSTEYDWADDTTQDFTTVTTPAIVNDAVNDVALKVLAGAPERDAATGLLFATKAWATDGGVSVGVDTGDVWNRAGATVGDRYVEFLPDSTYLTNNGASQTFVFPIPTADSTDVNGYERRYYGSNAPTLDVGAPKVLYGAGITGIPTVGDGLAFGDIAAGLTLITENYTNYFDGLFSWTTTAYNTGFGKGEYSAWACDDSTDPIGFPFDLYDDFDEPNVTVFEDTFNRADPAPWVAGVDTALSIVNSTLKVASVAPSSTSARAIFAYSFDVDKWHKVRATLVESSLASRELAISPDTTSANAIATVQAIAGEEGSVTFKPTQENLNILLFGSATETDTFRWDNVTIDEVPALDGWEPFFDAGAFIENGQVHVTKDDTISGSGARLLKAFPVVAGKHYNLFAGYGEALVGTVAEVAVSETEATGTALARIQTATSFNNQLASFTAADSELNLLLVTSSNLGDESVFDNITVQEALVENGTFDTDTGWTKGVGVTISGGTANAVAVVGGTDIVRQDGILTAGVTYAVEWTISDYTDGDARISVSGDVGLTRSAAGTYVEFVTPTGANFTVGASTLAFTGSIDNVIVTEALPDYSVADNPLQVIGQVTKEDSCDPPTGCCVQSVVVDANNYVKGTVQTPGELVGYEKIDGVYVYRAATSEWQNATETAGALEIRSADGTPVPVKQLRWNQ